MRPAAPRSRLALAAVLTALVGAGGPAAGSGPDDEAPPAKLDPGAAPEEPAAPTPAPTTAEDELEAAKAHAAAGSAYFDQGDWADAARELEWAHRLSRRPELLETLSVCYERLGRDDDAVAALRRYLEARPDATDREAVLARIEGITQRRVPRATSPAPPLPPRPRGWWRAGTAVALSGAALLTASLGAGLGAHAIHQDLLRDCPGRVCDESRRADADRGRALGVASDVLLGVGLAATVAGGILLLVRGLGGPRRHAPGPPPSLRF